MEESLTVTQLNTKVQTLLRGSKDLNDIWVRGEISNLTRASSGHYYFTLKEQGSEVRCALWASSRQRMSFEPKDNMKVLAFGSADLYVQRGSYQFIIQTMRQAGIGELYLRFEELKSRLRDEGLFDESRKRPIPQYPKVIGVVTSETGAVIHDIITTSESRYPSDILLAPSMVQGEGAARTIVAGIEMLNRVGVDVIIVGRGGGSLEDLWPFNEEIVASAIVASEAPVVSAVGHETDFTIADFVADKRAPTPTGAAATILRDKVEIRKQLDRDMAMADKALKLVIDRMRARFDILDVKLSPESAQQDLDMKGMELDSLWGRADRALASVLERMTGRFQVIESKLSPAVALRDIESKGLRLDSLYSRVSPDKAIMDLESKENRLENVYGEVTSLSSKRLSDVESRVVTTSARLESLNPLRVMERGYGIVLGPDGRAVTSTNDLLVGEVVDIRLRDGRARASIKEVREERK